MALTPAAQRVRPSLRRASIVVLAVLAPLAAHQAWDYVEARRLVSELQRIRERGEPVSDPQSVELRPGYSDAGAYYAAAGLVGFDRSADFPSKVIEFGDSLEERLLEPSALAAARQGFDGLAATSGDALHLADRAAALEYNGPPYMLASVVPGFGQSVSALVAVRTISLALQGRGDEALLSAETGIRARRAVHEAWFSRGEREIAAVLSLSTPSASALLRAQTALEAGDRCEADAKRFLRARARYIDEGWYGAAAPRLLVESSPGSASWLVRPWVTHQAVETLRTWARLLEVVRLPWPERIRASTAVRAQQESYVARGWLTRRVLAVPVAPVLANFFVATNPKPIAIDRSARVALAIERYRRDNEGRLPDSLSMLVPTYLASIPADPYSGGPLRYRTMPGAYTIYSVGDDGRDDRGDLSSVQARVEAGSRVVTKGRDVGLRVWLR